LNTCTQSALETDGGCQELPGILVLSKEERYEALAGLIIVGGWQKNRPSLPGCTGTHLFLWAMFLWKQCSMLTIPTGY